jgi:hypothetical protein
MVKLFLILSKKAWLCSQQDLIHTILGPEVHTEAEVALLTLQEEAEVDMVIHLEEATAMHQEVIMGMPEVDIRQEVAMEVMVVVEDTMMDMIVDVVDMKEAAVDMKEAVVDMKEAAVDMKEAEGVTKGNVVDTKEDVVDTKTVVADLILAVEVMEVIVVDTKVVAEVTKEAVVDMKEVMQTETTEATDQEKHMIIEVKDMQMKMNTNTNMNVNVTIHSMNATTNHTVTTNNTNNHHITKIVTMNIQNKNLPLLILQNLLREQNTQKVNFPDHLPDHLLEGIEKDPDLLNAIKQKLFIKMKN